MDSNVEGTIDEIRVESTLTRMVRKNSSLIYDGSGIYDSGLEVKEVKSEMGET